MPINRPLLKIGCQWRLALFSNELQCHNSPIPWFSFTVWLFSCFSTDNYATVRLPHHVQRLCPRRSSPGFESDLRPFAVCQPPAFLLSHFLSSLRLSCQLKYVFGFSNLFQVDPLLKQMDLSSRLYCTQDKCLEVQLQADAKASRVV